MDYSAFFQGQSYMFPNQAVYNSDAGSTPHGVDQTTPYDAFEYAGASTASPSHPLDQDIPQSMETEPFPALDLHRDYSETRQLDIFARQEGRSSSEDNPFTPAQNKRKAQNRAAQRAFRERKEKHMKDIETRINDLESSKSNLANDNQRLKLALQRILTENELLRATSSGGGTRRGIMVSDTSPLDAPHGESSRTDQETLEGYDAQQDEGDVNSDSGPTLTMPQVWDYIVEHPMIKSGRVDIVHTVALLRQTESPIGRNKPMYSERDVQRAIECSRRAGGDSLM